MNTESNIIETTEFVEVKEDKKNMLKSKKTIIAGIGALVLGTALGCVIGKAVRDKSNKNIDENVDDYSEDDDYFEDDDLDCDSEDEVTTNEF